MARLHTGRDKVLSLLPLLPRQHRRRDHRDRRPAALAQRVRRPATCTSSGRTCTARAFWATTEEEECERALDHLEQVIQFEGPATIAAILLETVVGTAGVLIPPPGYLAGVRALCDKYGIVLIARRGHGRLRPYREVVRVRALRRACPT